MKVAVLGATGMLGSQVLRVLEASEQIDVTATCRDRSRVGESAHTSTKILELDAGSIQSAGLIDLIGGCDWWINCIGLIKPYIHDDNPLEVAEAITVNSLFSALLAQAADQSKTRLIQIATDCVWDGIDGNYSENSHHNATDVYGKSKSLGEVHSEYSHTIRCSIIGREYEKQISLLDWFLSQDRGSKVNGFCNHFWNGVTTLQFSKICKGVIEGNVPLKFMQHLVPADQVSKFQLLEIFAKYFDRQDIDISSFSTKIPVNRAISTIDPEHNKTLWEAGGYSAPPSIEESVAELASVAGP